MTVILRDYQQKGVDEIRQAYQDGHKSVLFQLPTGGGKTLTAGYILSGAAARGNTSMFICNRVELLAQTATAFDRLDMQYGTIAAGQTPNPFAPVQIASIDTLKRRLDKVRPPKLIVWDECRGLGAAGWTDVYKCFPDAVHLGLDATPIRLDGKGLGQFFTKMVCGPTYSQLVAIGSLVPFKAFAPTTPDMSGVKTKMGEFDAKQTEDIMDKPTLVGDIVQHYIAHARGMQGLTFAVSRAHSEHLAEQYRAAGIRAEHLDGETDKAERAKMVAAYRRREIDMFCNVNLFSAGFDVPGVQVIVDAAPTQSLAMFMQRAGRASRPEPEIGKTHGILLDCGGNVFRHGLPDMDREWSLDGAPKKKKKKGEESAVPVRQCDKCYAVFAPAKVCPACGAIQIIISREIDHIDGELREISPEMVEAMRKAKAQEVGRAKTLDALEAIAAERGYSPMWAAQVFQARERAAQRRASAQYEAFRR